MTDIEIAGDGDSHDLPLQSFSVFLHHTGIHNIPRKQIDYSTNYKIARHSANALLTSSLLLNRNKLRFH